MQIQNLRLYRGDDHELIYTAEVDGRMIDFSGGHLLMQVRESENGNLLFELNSDNGDFELSDDGLSVKFLISSDKTEGAFWTKALYDVEFTDTNSKKHTLTRGQIILTHDISQNERRI